MLTPLEEESLDTLELVKDYFAVGRPKLKRGYVYVMGQIRDTIVHLTNKKLGCKTGKHSGSQACNCGYTLVELMIVIAILAILATVGMSSVSGTIRRSQEARTKGNLAMLRASITMYYADHEGLYPIDDLASLQPKYLRAIPLKMTPPYHPEGNTVSAGPLTDMTDSRGDWFYVNDGSSSDFGKVMVNCIHSTLKGEIWSNQ
jgi:prepilin-type N-terminal cleavage/methylation domain-containing protein